MARARTSAARAQSAALHSEPDAAGHVTVVLTQTVGATRYFDAAGAMPALAVVVRITASPSS